MMSMGASGSLANAMVFSQWKGRPYVRALVKPANPRSGGQVGIRAMMKWLSQQWNGLADVDKATWEDRAAQKTISPFNAYIGLGVSRWRDFLAPSLADPPDVLETPPTLGTLAGVPGVRSITITQPITTAADGWGVAIFRGLADSFTTLFDNLIGVGTIVATADVVYVDSPLAAGTYYYNVRSITGDGQLSAQGTDIEVVVA